MSSLKDRLRRLTGSGSGTSSGEVSVGRGEESVPEDGEAGVTQSWAPAASEERETARESECEEPLGPAWESLNAKLVSNEWGSFIRRRLLYPNGHMHGRYRLSDLNECAGELSAFHGDGTMTKEDLLFFDTETTGLGLGAGNVPFMIGIGFWEPDGFAVEQLFIRSPAEEAAMLAYFRQVLERHPYLVSYNGRSFDWPVLKNRFVLNRMKDGVPDPVHLDFLYPSRSLWRNTLPSCRLGQVEESRLGFRRRDDIPGSMAPELYFLYLADHNPRSVEPVFLHNELDVLSLAGLALHFALALGGSADTSWLEPEERFRLGLWLDKLGKRDLSLRVLDPLSTLNRESTSGRSRPVYLDYGVPLAAHYKRVGEWERAVFIWQELVLYGKTMSSPAGPPLEPYIELSMHFEHRMKDPASALQFAEEARDWAMRRRNAMRSVLQRPARSNKPSSAGYGPMPPLLEDAFTPGQSSTSLHADLAKRIERLQRKLSREKKAKAISKPRKSDPNRPKTRKRAAGLAEQETLNLF